MNELYEKYGQHPLYGRRVLHVLSPVRWKSSRFIHELDANYKVMDKTVNWLPMCHHYILVPPYNSIPNDRENVTLIKFPYAGSVLFNRGYFNSKEFLKVIDFTKIDVDFIFNHQPELMYSVMNAVQTDRYGGSVDNFLFFHWVDSKQSKPSGDFPDGFMRQLEAINMSTKTYFHCDSSLDYLKSNFEKECAFTGINEQYVKDKISYMPLSPDKFPEPHSFKLPDKKILVFNHRWNKTTGITKLASYTKDLSDEYLIWFTDRNANKPKAGKPVSEVFKDHKCSIHVEGLSREQYRYLIENCHATLCFVDKYMTWNLAVLDGVYLNTPTLVYEHPVEHHILGEDYKWFFKDKKSFLQLLEDLDNIPFDNPQIDWELPNHDGVFQQNLYDDMIECMKNKRIRDSKDGPKWLWHILKGNGYKKHLLYNTHPNLYLSNVWEYLRLWCLDKGVKDDPLSKYTKMFVPDDVRDELEKLVNGIDLGESKLNPKFQTNENVFW